MSISKKRVLGVALVGAALTMPAAALATTASADPVDGTATAANVDWDGGWNGDHDGDNGRHGHRHHHRWFHRDVDWDDDSFGSATGVVNGLETIVDGVIGGLGQIVGSAD